MESSHETSWNSGVHVRLHEEASRPLLLMTSKAQRSVLPSRGWCGFILIEKFREQLLIGIWKINVCHKYL